MLDLSHVALDPLRLKPIQTMHPGFLYQHLYSVAALRTSEDSKLEALLLEKDEDKELVFPDKRVGCEGFEVRDYPFLTPSVKIRKAQCLQHLAVAILGRFYNAIVVAV
jgi:hypothetical protein